jgi:zinc protease
VGVTGNAPAGLEDSLASLFPAGVLCAAPARLPEPVRRGPRVLVVSHPAARAATVRMLAPYSVTRAHPDHPALVLFASYLGLSGQFIGRLMQAVRESRGLNYGDYAYAEHIEPSPFSRGPAAHAVRSQQGFEIMLRPMTPTHVPFVTRLVFRELERALAVLPAADLERVSGFLDGFLPLWLETPDARLGSALDQAYFGLDDPYVSMLQGAFRALDAEEVREAAARHVRPSELRIVIVTPDALATRDALLRERLEPLDYDHPVSAEVVAEDHEINAYALGLDEDDIAIVDVSALFVR